MRRVLVYLFMFDCVSCIVRPPTAAEKFIALQHQRGNRPRILVDIVHHPHWNIGYSYGADCAAEQRNNDDVLTETITAVLQMWLQPLREYENKQGKIVADFRYFLGRQRDASDLSVVFHCNDESPSTASVRRASPPLIDLREGDLRVDRDFTGTLAHEMGHAFGLADTYIPGNRDGDPLLDKGAWDGTKGTQPSSIMMTLSEGHKDGGIIGKDDKNGVIWLYKTRHEGLPDDDCFFDDYELEHVPLGCRPKHPLIFELKHVSETTARIVIQDDEHLDVNVRDAEGMTALHYAVLYNYRRVIEALLRHKDIKPYLTNRKGKTPAQLAKDLEYDELAQLIAAHPKALPVAAQGKKTMPWGELKRGDR